jgi:hypothetical protein
MPDFKFAAAALAGVDLLRRRPLQTLGLALVGTVGSLGGRVCILVSDHLQANRSPRSLPDTTLDGFASLAIILILIVVASVIGAAVMRAVATDEPAGQRPRFGADEVRLLLLSSLLVPGLFIVLLALFIGGAITSVARESFSGGDVFMTGAASIGAAVAIGLASRFCLAGPLTVRDGRLRLKASWRMTQAQPWKVFSVFVIALGLGFVVGVLGMFALNRATSGLNLSTWQAYGPSLTDALVAAIQPVKLAYLLAQGLLIGLALILYSAPPAKIYRDLASETAADQVAVFD